MNGNDIPNTATFADANGTVGGTAYQIIWDRYEQAFVTEMKAFAKAIVNNEETPITGEDGLYPVLMAAAKDDGFEAVEFWDWRIRDLDKVREATQAAEITHLIDSPYLMILFDAYHMQYNDGALCYNIFPTVRYRR